MKRNLLAFFAIALAVTFSAFSVKNTVAKNESAQSYLLEGYYQFSTTATDQTDFANYSPLTPPILDCDDDNKLCWIKVVDVVAPIGTINQADFTQAFEAVDGSTGDDDNTLNDEDEIEGVFEKRQNGN